MKRKGLIAGGLMVLVLLLAGAAFVGGRLLNSAASAWGERHGDRLIA